MEVKNDDLWRIIRGVMFHFKPSALIRWSADNSKVPVGQFEERVSTRFDQTQGLRILANFRNPKETVGSFMIFEVFYSRTGWIQVNIQFIVYCLAWIFDTHAKVLGHTNYNGIRSFDWTSKSNPFRRRICFITAHVCFSTIFYRPF